MNEIIDLSTSVRPSGAYVSVVFVPSRLINWSDIPLYRRATPIPVCNCLDILSSCRDRTAPRRGALSRHTCRKNQHDSVLITASASYKKLLTDVLLRARR